MKYYERWWHESLSTRRPEFVSWLAQSDPSSRAAVAARVDAAHEATGQPVSVLECGPGIYLDHGLYWHERPYVRYQAVDVTPQIVADGVAQGLDVREGSVEALPFADASVDLVYCRHVLEHLPSYRQALSEMWRVCGREAVAVLWRVHEHGPDDEILFDTVPDVPQTYHNRYSLKAISAYLDARGIEHTWTRPAVDWVLVMRKG